VHERRSLHSPSYAPPFDGFDVFLSDVDPKELEPTVTPITDVP
jgi:hypothetical protein